MDMVKLLELLERNSIKIGSMKYPPLLLIWVAFFLFIIYVIRVFVWAKMDNRSKRKPKLLYMITHQMFCWIFAIVISFFSTAIFAADSVILNGIVCPSIGYIGSMLFDIYILTKLDTGYGYNLDNVGNSNHKSNYIIGSEKSLEEYTKKPSDNDYLSDEQMMSSDHNMIIKDKINSMIDCEYIEAIEIKKIYNELVSISIVLDSLRETMKDDKKLKLEKWMYECLNKGFATPEENKIITTNYQNYRALRGNGEIEELYTNHYINLPVHEDRRKATKKEDTLI